MPLDFNEIRQLLVTIAQTDIAELTLKSDDFELSVRKNTSVSSQINERAGSTPSGGISGEEISPLSTTSFTSSEAAPKQQSNAAQPAIDKKWVDVPSPMVGTFYRAPAPSEPPFVEVGDRVKNGQTVCIIEAMKLMNEIEAEVNGQVMEILVGNGEPVEYGQPLMRINPEQ